MSEGDRPPQNGGGKEKNLQIWCGYEAFAPEHIFEVWWTGGKAMTI